MKTTLTIIYKVIGKRTVDYSFEKMENAVVEKTEEIAPGIVEKSKTKVIRLTLTDGTVKDIYYDDIFDYKLSIEK